MYELVNRFFKKSWHINLYCPCIYLNPTIEIENLQYFSPVVVQRCEPVTLSLCIVSLAGLGGPTIARIAGSNPAEGMVVRLLCLLCVL